MPPAALPFAAAPPPGPSSPLAPPRRCATSDCKQGNLDFSNPAFLELTGLSPDRVKIEWQWTSCAPYIQGNIRLDPKSYNRW